MSGHSTSLLRAHWWLPNVLGVNSKVPQWLTKTFTISFKYFSDITSCLRSSRASCHLFTCPSTEFRKATLCSTLGYCHFEDFADVWTGALHFHFIFILHWALWSLNRPGTWPLLPQVLGTHCSSSLLRKFTCETIIWLLLSFTWAPLREIFCDHHVHNVTSSPYVESFL